MGEKLKSRKQAWNDPRSQSFREREIQKVRSGEAKYIHNRCGHPINISPSWSLEVIEDIQKKPCIICKAEQIQGWMKKHDIPLLTSGTVRQQAFADTIRFNMLDSALKQGLDIEKLKLHTDARWWIDHRFLSIESLLLLL